MTHVGVVNKTTKWPNKIQEKGSVSNHTEYTEVDKLYTLRQLEVPWGFCCVTATKNTYTNIRENSMVGSISCILSKSWEMDKPSGTPQQAAKSILR